MLCMYDMLPGIFAALGIFLEAFGKIPISKIKWHFYLNCVYIEVFRVTTMSWMPMNIAKMNCGHSKSFSTYIHSLSTRKNQEEIIWDSKSRSMFCMYDFMYICGWISFQHWQYFQKRLERFPSLIYQNNHN